MVLVLGMTNNSYAQTAPIAASPDNWVLDADVSAAGAGIARSSKVLDWALKIEGSGFNSAGSSTASILSSLSSIWKNVRNLTIIVFILLLVIIGFGIMLRTDWGNRSRRLLPYIVITLIVMNFSFIASATFVRLSDTLQKDFYKMSGNGLAASNILIVRYDYNNFKGYRIADPSKEDAVRNQLWLVKSTTYTNYAIAGILILRIVLLWGLTIFSPFLFPFLIFPATRRVALVWVREFFRWLLIGPLLALFLSSVVLIWSQVGSGLTSTVTSTTPTPDEYSPATNIILTPPGSSGGGGIATGFTNGLSNTNDYMQYITMLIMLWVAIILPFLLLRTAIVMVGKNKTKIANRWDSSSAKQYLSSIGQRITQPAPRGPKPVPAAGLAKPIMVAGIAQPQKEVVTDKDRELARRVDTTNRISELKTESIMHLAGLTQAVPQVAELLHSRGQTLEKVSQIEMDSYKLAKTQEIFNKISKPETIENTENRRQYTDINNSILSQSTRGDTDARKIQKAVENNISNFETANTRDEIQKQLVKKFADEVTYYSGSTTSTEQSSQNFQKTYNTTTNNVREYLQEKSGQKDDTAKVALQALDKIAQVAQVAVKPISQITSKDKNSALSVASKMQHPEAIADEDEKQQFTALRDFVDKGKQLGDMDAATLEYSGRLMLWSKDAEDKNKLTNDVDKKLLERTTTGDKDFKKSKQLWKKHYTQAPVPTSEKIKSRRDWLLHEKRELQSALNKILSDDAEARKAGLEEVKKVIPFMIMGDYSLTDIAKYIMAKISAIDSAFKDLEMIEGNNVDEKKKELRLT